MESLGFPLRREAFLEALTLESLKSHEIEGQLLDAHQVRSSIARLLGMDIAGLISSDRHVEGVVEMMLDTTQHFDTLLSKERLFGWHACLFPTGRSGMQRIIVGAWRDNSLDPMQVVSGAMGKEKIHFEVPPAEGIDEQVENFNEWFNDKKDIDPVFKAAIAHLWFVTIHPFDDGNSRIARAIADMQLARADETAQRFYSMSAQIRKEGSAYYQILEKTQKRGIDITSWIQWFLACLNRALTTTEHTFAGILRSCFKIGKK